jgi:hypothetical protein
VAKQSAQDIAGDLLITRTGLFMHSLSLALIRQVNVRFKRAWVCDLDPESYMSNTPRLVAGSVAIVESGQKELRR